MNNWLYSDSKGKLETDKPLQEWKFKSISPSPSLNQDYMVLLELPVCVRAQSHLTLCDPMDCSLPGTSVPGIFQARILEWVAISFSRASFWPRDGIHLSCIGRQILYCWATREALFHWWYYVITRTVQVHRTQLIPLLGRRLVREQGKAEAAGRLPMGKAKLHGRAKHDYKREQGEQESLHFWQGCWGMQWVLFVGGGGILLK